VLAAVGAQQDLLPKIAPFDSLLPLAVVKVGKM
jgi:hypothetical protein